jgi:hypothetical protein
MTISTLQMQFFKTCFYTKYIISKARLASESLFPGAIHEPFRHFKTISPPKKKKKAEQGKVIPSKGTAGTNSNTNP